MNDFYRTLTAALEEYEIDLDTAAVDRLCAYYELLIEWNERMNLTALTEPRDVAVKHFIDSLLLLRYVQIGDGASVIDVGTGAGFPGAVLKIARPDIRLTLLDSLQKRLIFLQEVCDHLGLDGVQIVHSRAEDGARTELRDSYDLAVARAVASLNVLSEYCLPYVKPGGRFIAMKGSSAARELDEAQGAISQLGGGMENLVQYTLTDPDDRGIVVIHKLSPTPEKFPRKSKQIKSKPL
jgi:16S rRNA (guanine527-N7)-methyltransferase